MCACIPGSVCKEVSGGASGLLLRAQALTA